jgi:deoxyribodipyrimidine photo-lyase
VNGDTEYPLINAGMHQLVGTGYMLNRLRMLTTSYLTQDNGLWWKYPEQFFANFLTDYDWTINSMNHQNIAKVGLYPKYTLDFSIARQEKMNPKDKQKYIEEYQGQN